MVKLELFLHLALSKHHPVNQLTTTKQEWLPPASFVVMLAIFFITVDIVRCDCVDGLAYLLTH